MDDRRRGYSNKVKRTVGEERDKKLMHDRSSRVQKSATHQGFEISKHYNLILYISFPLQSGKYGGNNYSL